MSKHNVQYKANYVYFLKSNQIYNNKNISSIFWGNGVFMYLCCGLEQRAAYSGLNAA